VLSAEIFLTQSSVLGLSTKLFHHSLPKELAEISYELRNIPPLFHQLRTQSKTPAAFRSKSAEAKPTTNSSGKKPEAFPPAWRKATPSIGERLIEKTQRVATDPPDALAKRASASGSDFTFSLERIFSNARNVVGGHAFEAKQLTAGKNRAGIF